MKNLINVRIRIDNDVACFVDYKVKVSYSQIGKLIELLYLIFHNKILLNGKQLHEDNYINI